MMSKSLGHTHFCGCSDLKSIEIPDNVSEIQVAAFDDCSNLTAIHIPAGVDKIALGVFMGCSNLNSITIDSANRSYESPGNANAIIDKGTMTLLEGSNNTVIPEGVKKNLAKCICGTYTLKEYHNSCKCNIHSRNAI